MHILLIYPDLSFRGGETLFANLAQGLIQQNHQVTLITARKSQNPKPFPPQTKIITPPQLLNHLFQNNYLFPLLSLPITFINILRHAPQADALYTAEPHISLWPAVLAAKLTKKKLILSTFELGPTPSTSLRGRRQRQSPTGFIPRYVNSLPDQIFSSINTFFLQQIQHATTLNPNLISPLKQKYNIPHITTILPGIDFTKFQNPNPQKIKTQYNLQNQNLLLMTGVLHPAKRQDLAIDILNQVKQKLPNTTLLITGDGNPGYKQLLIKKIQTLNLQKNVILTGLIPEEDLKNYYAATDILLQCGPIAGLTIIEALLMKKLPIYPTSGTPPQGPVEPLNLGIILPQNNPQLYTQKIIDYLTTPQKYQQKLHQDHQLVQQKFSLKTFTEQTLKVIKENS